MVVDIAPPEWAELIIKLEFLINPPPYVKIAPPLFNAVFLVKLELVISKTLLDKIAPPPLFAELLLKIQDSIYPKFSK